MAINTSQDKSLQKTAVDLRSPVFAHGQLLLVLSKATSTEDLLKLLPENTGQTGNVVYPKALFRVAT